MNFLKKLKQPLTPRSKANSGNSNTERDLEDDLYDEYVVEAPPHPSELLALGVDPSADVDVEQKLKEIYSKSKVEGNRIACNSVLLAKQRQKEEIEEKKKTREEWKYFDSLTARVQQAVDHSKKTLDHLKESSAIDEISQPEYELKLSADQIFKSSSGVKQEKGANNWVDFGEEDNNNNNNSSSNNNSDSDSIAGAGKQADGTGKKEEPVEEGDKSQLPGEPFGGAGCSTPLLDILCETSEPIVPSVLKTELCSGPDPFDTSFVKI